MKILSPLMALALLLPLASCGYSLAGRGSALPADIKTISIPLFENKSVEPAIDNVVTAEVRDAFILDGRLRVYDGASADSVLTGVINAIDIQAIAFNANNEVSSYSVNLAITVKHLSNHSGKVLMKQRIDTALQYKVDESIIEVESLRVEAIRQAAKTMSESLVSLVVEAF